MKSVYLVVMVVLVEVVIVGQQKTATGGAFCSVQVPTSNSKIQAWSVLSCFRKILSFSKV